MMIPPGFLLFVLIFIFMGISLFLLGFFWLKRKRLIENIPTSKIRSLAMGLVEIYGRVIPIKDKILKSPFSEKDCVYYRYTVEEYRKSGKNSHWVTIKKGEGRDLFYLQDDTGRVLIDAKGAKIEIAKDNEFSSGFMSDPPDSVKRFLAANNLAFEGLLGMNKTMRYRESFIEPNDTLYIFGTADDNPYVEDTKAYQGAEDIIIKKGKTEKLFYISDKQEREILRGLTWRATLGIVGGGLLIVLGVMWMVVFLGG